MFKSPNYEIARFMMFFGVIQTCFVPANVTALFIILVGYVEAQMVALTQEVQYIWSDTLKHIERHDVTSEEEKQRITSEFVREKLHDIIKRHGIVKGLFQRLDSIFRIVLIIEFMLLMIAIIFELLGGLENTYMQMPYAFMQVTMDCFSGQRVMEAGMAFEEAVYASNWENFDVSNKKTILTILHCSQKSLTISAGGITSLSYTSLMSIFRSVYSAYATLRHTVHRN